MSINYDLTSFVPHFSKEEMASMHQMLSLDLPNFAFDPAYTSHVENFHGGKPIDKYFSTRKGRRLPIDRFLNYADTDLLTEKSLKGLNANVAWALIEDRLNEYLLPFAILPNGDFLCFDYTNGFPPAVVLWNHEFSEEDAPHLEPVADNFSEFLQNLSPTF